MTRYYPDDDGGEREWEYWNEKVWVPCLPFEDETVDGEEDEDEFPPEDF